MSKFNNTATIRTTNLDGHVAYAMKDKAKLVTQVLTSFFNESKFYGDNSADLVTTLKNVIKTDPAFVSKLAVFARREFNMRTVAHVLTGYLAHEVEGKPYVKDTIRGICLRGDDATELMAFYLNTFGRPIPNSVRKGINAVFTGFDEYTLAKYKGDGKAVKMRDLVCLCHPAPKDNAQSEMWKRLLEDKLATPLTWETELSANGNNKRTWEKLIDSGKVGYMAVLRNLRNIVNANPDNIEKVWSYIENPNAVRKSKQLPFRFLSAYRELGDQRRMGSRGFDALENAMDASIDNIPKLPGTTVIAVDVSGSMSSQVSYKSDIRCVEIGMMLGLIANRICENSLFYTFYTRIQKYAMSRRAGILETVVHNSACGGGTNIDLPFDVMIRDNIKADRVIIISDNECNSGWSSWNHKPVQARADAYRKQTHNDLWVHAIDLQGYGTQQFAGPKTNIIAGWSEKVFNFILLAEQGEGNLEKAIEAYKW